MGRRRGRKMRRRRRVTRNMDSGTLGGGRMGRGTGKRLMRGGVVKRRGVRKRGVNRGSA